MLIDVFIFWVILKHIVELEDLFEIHFLNCFFYWNKVLSSHTICPLFQTWTFSSC
jgi:hypothetical protein